MREGCASVLFVVLIAVAGGVAVIIMVNSPVRDALADAIYMVGLALGVSLVIASLALLAHASVRLVHALRGVVEIRPGPDGQPPALRMRFKNGVTVIHQLDRSPSPVTIFDAQGRPYFAFPDGQEDLQAQALRGAQQIQVVRAAVSGAHGGPRQLPNVLHGDEDYPARRIGHVRVIEPDEAVETEETE